MKRTPERCYCLARCADGRWLLLNRDYKPFREGITTFVDYETCPGTRLSLSEAQLHHIEYGCKAYQLGDRMVWTYSDATRPEKSRSLCAAYLERIAVLGL